LNTNTGVKEQVKIAPSNGKQVNLPANSQDLQFRGPNKVLNQLGGSLSQNMIASESSESIMPIKATMEIIGDPYYTGVLNLIQKRLIQVIFINPFCIKQKGVGGSCEFLAEPPVNDVFSGIYFINGCNHNITKGSFTTTLDIVKMVGDVELN